jgi:hypothetical protein
LTTYIRQDLANKSLLINALAQIIIKILYQKELNKDEILKETITILNYRIKPERIASVLDILTKNGTIINSRNYFSLVQKTKQSIDDLTNIRNRRFEKALETYFKNSGLSKDVLSNWFDDMNITFFNNYNTEWIEDFIGRSKEKRTYIENFYSLDTSNILQKHHIPNCNKEWLFGQYIQFLKSNDSENGALMLDYANSLFASKLVSANIFADSSIKEMFSGTKVIFDTNVLLYLNLENDKYADAYKALEEVFILLDIKPIYFHITKNEYNRAVEHKIRQMQKVIDDYDEEVLMQSDDVFLQTLFYRNCKNEEEYNIYYDEIRNIPKFIFSDLEITEYDNREIIEYIDSEVSKNIYQQKMNEIFQRRHAFSKKKTSLDHDAGLISGLGFLKNESEAWILTRDGTVHNYSLEHTKQGERPIAVNLGTIINLLCINEGSIDIDSSDFAPIFSQFVKNKVAPLLDCFQLEDLTRMSEIESSVSQLPKENLVNLANEINRDRMKGEADEKIALKIQRNIQAYKIEIKDELASTKIDLSASKEREKKLLEKQEQHEVKYKEQTKNDLISKKMPKLLRCFIVGCVFQMLLLIILFFILMYFIILNKQSILSSIICSVVVNILTGFVSYKRLWIPNYLRQKENKLKEIDIEVEKKWNELNKDNNL